MPDEKQEPFSKQIENTLINVAIILACGPLAYLSLEWLKGDFNVHQDHPWQAIARTLSTGLVISVLMAFAWISMRSPLGKRFRMLAVAVRSDEDGSTQEMKVALEQPASSSDQTRTTEIDPKTQKVTITETPTPPTEPAAPDKKGE